MKKYVHLSLLVFILLLGSCSGSKNDLPVPAKGKRISAVYIDGTPFERYYYRPDKKIDRVVYYLPDGSVSYRLQYAYDAAGILASVRHIKADGSLKTEQVFVKDASGRITGSRFINFGIFAQDSKYEYDDAVPARVIRIRDYDTTGVPTIVREYSYNGGLLAARKVFVVNGPALELLNESQYSAVADPELLARHRETVSSLTSPEPETWLVYSVSSQVLYASYQGALVTNDYIFECMGRVTDERKYTLSVEYRTKFLKPAQPDKLSTYRYEYVDL